ncbi:HAD family hydrolase [Catenovulum sp. SM1970]|uniref:HAD family hydrolase n=1 Tax=Marinifaba aquimaris TaxID=2741323 RepID=UPI00157324C6|nr:HAD family hydrolase [Marinifaba aquimaris]NTS76807.1 HAD family hydrolase [Marinifaba aquimaris]
MNLALFDFDGTITNEDTFTQFIFFVTNKRRLILGLVLLSPVIILYKLGLLKAPTVRPIIANFVLFNRTTAEIEILAEQFVQSYLPQVMRQNALAKLQWHKDRGDTLYVVSATVDVYLRIWCRQNQLNLLCSKVEHSKGKYTGRYANFDCSGNNKVKAIESAIDLSRYNKIYAYGDTPEDIPMLKCADQAYYRWQDFDLR